MPGGRGSIRGDVNVILNGLIRDGVIAAFETSFDKLKTTTKRVSIRVVAPSTNNPDAVKRAVVAALGRFAADVSVTVKAG
jgi:hypothetical protein